MTELLVKRRGLVVLAAALLFLLHCGLYLRCTVDDSFISYRFARNWADGSGPVYQAGDRVEGYTCFGWVALLAGAHRLGFDVELASKVLGIAAGVLCIIGVAAISHRLLNGRPAYLAAPFVLALSPFYAAWACSGMEATLFSAMIVWAAYALALDESRSPLIPGAAVLLGLSALVRPEGMLFGAIALASVIAMRNKRAGRWTPLKWAGTFCAIVAPYLAWRVTYYGSLVPNTFYAKTGRGLERLVSGAWCAANFAEYQGLAFVALCAIGILSLSRIAPGAASRFVRYGVLAFFAYVVWAGGDILHIRFFVHVMGLLALCAAAGLDRITSSWRWEQAGAPVVTYCALALAWVCLSGIGDYRALSARDQFGAAYVVSNSRNVRNANIPLGKWLAAHAKPSSSVAAWDIGGLGYYSGLRVIDMYGLTDRTIARLIHSRTSDQQKIAYVESKRPEFIVTYGKPHKPDLQWLGIAKNWVSRNYRFHSYWPGGPDGYGLALLVRRDSPLAASSEPLLPAR